MPLERSTPRRPILTGGYQAPVLQPTNRTVIPTTRVRSRTMAQAGGYALSSPSANLIHGYHGQEGLMGSRVSRIRKYDESTQKCIHALEDIMSDRAEQVAQSLGHQANEELARWDGGRFGEATEAALQTLKLEWKSLRRSLDNLIKEQLLTLDQNKAAFRVLEDVAHQTFRTLGDISRTSLEVEEHFAKKRVQLEESQRREQNRAMAEADKEARMVQQSIERELARLSSLAL